MKRVTLLLLAIALTLPLSACDTIDYSTALDTCQRCGWTEVDGLTPGHPASLDDINCTRIRDGNSEAMPIKGIMAECGIYPKPSE